MWDYQLSGDLTARSKSQGGAVTFGTILKHAGVEVLPEAQRHLKR